MINKKTVEIGGKKFIVSQAPATVAYEVALRFHDLNGQADTAAAQLACLNRLLKYVEVDLGDGRTMPLDSETVINQHISQVDDLVKLQKEVMAVNFGFFLKENPSGS